MGKYCSCNTFFFSPVSENDEGFEVTMTATADGDLSEEGVAQIQVKLSLFFYLFPLHPKWTEGLTSYLLYTVFVHRCCVQILQEDEDCLSPNQKTEVSPVSQAWFTTKEDKDTLANKGTHNSIISQD